MIELCPFKGHLMIKRLITERLTNIEMIGRFYAKPLSGEMNIDMLLSKRRLRVGNVGGLMLTGKFPG